MKNFIVGNMGYGGPVVVRHLRQAPPRADLLLSCHLKSACRLKLMVRDGSPR
jgi:hypothetical protein